MSHANPVENSSVLLPTLLLILTFLLAITWGIAHEQHDLRDKALERLAATGVDPENYEIRFSGRDAYIGGDNVTADAVRRTGEMIASLPGVRKVHYNPVTADTIDNAQPEDGSNDIAKSNSQPVTKNSLNPVVLEDNTGTSKDGTEKEAQTQPTVSAADPSMQKVSVDSKTKSRLQYQLDGFLAHGAFLFPIGSLAWPPTMQQALIETSGFLKYNPDLKLEIAGFSEPIGDTRREKQLSELRAQQVRTQLIYLGVDATRLVSKGYGFDRSKQDRFVMPSSIRFIVQGDI